tara:strand:+ start:232 stop:963 length:732 start_codon:yes stop_codon:yes gene_type:complete
LSLKGVTPKEELSLSRSVNYKNTGFKPEISPYEVGRLLTKCIDSGNTVQELTDFFQYGYTKSVIDLVNIYKNSNENIAHLIVFDEQELYKRGIGYITFDVARILVKFDKKYQEELAIATVDFQMDRYDLEGMKQRMDRSGLPFKEVLKEFKKRKEDPVVTTLLTFFLDKKVLDLMSSEKGKKVFYKTLEMPEVKTLFKENNKNIVQAQCSEALYSLTISGGKLTKEFRNIVDLSIERLLIENA